MREQQKMKRSHTHTYRHSFVSKPPTHVAPTDIYNTQRFNKKRTKLHLDIVNGQMWPTAWTTHCEQWFQMLCMCDKDDSCI